MSTLRHTVQSAQDEYTKHQSFLQICQNRYCDGTRLTKNCQYCIVKMYCSMVQQCNFSHLSFQIAFVKRTELPFPDCTHGFWNVDTATYCSVCQGWIYINHQSFLHICQNEYCDVTRLTKNCQYCIVKMYCSIVQQCNFSHLSFQIAFYIYILAILNGTNWCKFCMVYLGIVGYCLVSCSIVYYYWVLSGMITYWYLYQTFLKNPHQKSSQQKKKASLKLFT